MSKVDEDEVDEVKYGEVRMIVAGSVKARLG